MVEGPILLTESDNEFRCDNSSEGSEYFSDADPDYIEDALERGSELSQLKQRVQQLEYKNRELLASAESGNTKHHILTQSLRRQLASARKDNASFQSRLSDAEKAKKTLQEENDSLRKEVASFRKDGGDAIDSLNDSKLDPALCRELSTSVRVIKSMLGELKEEVVSETKIWENSKQVVTKQCRELVTKSCIPSPQKNISKSSGELDQVVLNQHREQLKSLRLELKDLRSYIFEEKDVWMRGVLAYQSRLEQSIAAVDADFERIRKERGDLRSALGRERKTLADTKSSLTEQLESANSIIEELKLKEPEIPVRYQDPGVVTQLEEQLRLASIDRKKVNSDLEKSQARVEKLSMEIKKLMAHGMALKERNSELEAELESKQRGRSRRHHG